MGSPGVPAGAQGFPRALAPGGGAPGFPGRGPWGPEPLDLGGPLGTQGPWRVIRGATEKFQLQLEPPERQEPQQLRELRELLVLKLQVEHHHYYMIVYILLMN